MRSILIAALVLGFAQSQTSRAAIVLDQFNYEVPSQSSFTDFAIVENQSVAQSFTVGKAGLLTGIDLFVSKSSGLTGTMSLSVRPTIAGVPDLSATLIALTIDLASIPDSVPPEAAVIATFIDTLPFAIQVEPGDQLAISLERSAPASVPWALWSYGAPPDAYLGGEIFTRPGAGAWTALGATGDMAFATYVSAVPEPAAAALGYAGFVLYSIFRRRTRKSKSRPVSAHPS